MNLKGFEARTICYNKEAEGHIECENESNMTLLYSFYFDRFKSTTFLPPLG